MANLLTVLKDVQVKYFRRRIPFKPEPDPEEVDGKPCLLIVLKHVLIVPTQIMTLRAYLIGFPTMGKPLRLLDLESLLPRLKSFIFVGYDRVQPRCIFDHDWSTGVRGLLFLDSSDICLQTQHVNQRSTLDWAAE